MDKVYKNNACRIRFDITPKCKRRYKKILCEIKSKAHVQPIKYIFTSANRAGQFGE